VWLSQYVGLVGRVPPTRILGKTKRDSGPGMVREGEGK
jgi:hypothetical protein